MALKIHGERGKVCEWDYETNERYANPFDAIELDVIITAPSQKEWTVPAFWRGGLRWSVRFIPEESGVYTLQTRCSDPNNAELHAQKHLLIVSDTAHSDTPRRIGIEKEGNGLFTDNGKPFFWLADTWWMGLSDRIHFPDEFDRLAKDRKTKGFSVIQLVVGLFPDMDHFDPRAKNEAGFVWEEGYSAVNPAYFDAADRRIERLLHHGLIPCIVGAWGYYILKMGKKRMRQHWRYIIARWGAYPVIWCAAGEGAMPYYLSQNGPKERDRQIALWSDIVRYIHQTDAFCNLVTIHPTDFSTTQVSDPSVLDFAMIQAGHEGYESISRAVEMLRQHRRDYPSLPVVMAEMNYEGIMHDTHAEIQRLGFWASLLLGASGFSYGANGLWQCNRPDAPFGASPHGGTWGNTPWHDAMRLHGATHLGLAAQQLQHYPWHQIEPHPEWLSPSGDTAARRPIYVGGIPGKLRIIYIYGPLQPWSQPQYAVTGLEKGSCYKAYYWDTRTSARVDLPDAVPDKHGRWDIPLPPTFDDWLLVLENRHTVHPSPRRTFTPRQIAKRLKALLLR